MSKKNTKAQKHSKTQANKLNIKDAHPVHADVIDTSQMGEETTSPDSLSGLSFTNTVREMIKAKTQSLVYKPTKQVLHTLGISRNRFTRIYNKTNNPTFEEAIRICLYYNCSFSEIWKTVATEDSALQQKMLEKYS